MDNPLTNKENQLKKIIEKIKREGILFCPTCKKFTKINNLKFYGKDEIGMKIESIQIEDIEEFHGYKYQCSNCGMRIDSEKNLGEINV